jgi:hypothetical protein
MSAKWPINGRLYYLVNTACGTILIVVILMKEITTLSNKCQKERADSEKMGVCLTAQNEPTKKLGQYFSKSNFNRGNSSEKFPTRQTETVE